MRVFLDTNVVVDFCAKREDYFLPAAEIIDLGISGRIDLIISSLTFVNVAYIMRKAYSTDIVFQKLNKLAEICDISEIGGNVIRDSITKKSGDFEDCVQCLSAMSEDADIIVTRDRKGFKGLPLPFMTPTEFILKCQQQDVGDS